MEDLTQKHYPNIGQSVGIAGIMILMSIVTALLMSFTNKFIDSELSFFIYYVVAIGLTFWIVYLIRKRETGQTTFHFKIENKQIIPFIISFKYLW